MRLTMDKRIQSATAIAVTALATMAIGMAMTFGWAGKAFAEIDVDSIITLPNVETIESPQVETPPPAAEVKKQDAVTEPVKQQAAPKKAEQKKTSGEIKNKRKKETVAKKTKPEAKEEAAVRREPVPFLFGLFDARMPKPAELNDEQVQNDQAALASLKKKPPKIGEQFQKVTVSFSGYQPGTIVIDSKNKFLYFVQSPVAAIRYGVAIGKEGLGFTGKVAVGAKQPWPRWTPTREMIERDPKQYAQYRDGMDGGITNPLGARAIYLYQGRQDTYLRIHGTNQPNTIGTASSNGCFRMLNEHVIDLYDKVKVGAQVVVI